MKQKQKEEDTKIEEDLKKAEADVNNDASKKKLIGIRIQKNKERIDKQQQE